MYIIVFVWQRRLKLIEPSYFQVFVLHFQIVLVRLFIKEGGEAFNQFLFLLDLQFEIFDFLSFIIEVGKQLGLVRLIVIRLEWFLL